MQKEMFPFYFCILCVISVCKGKFFIIPIDGALLPPPPPHYSASVNSARASNSFTTPNANISPRESNSNGWRLLSLLGSSLSQWCGGHGLCTLRANCYGVLIPLTTCVLNITGCC